MEYSHKSYADKLVLTEEKMLVAGAAERNKQHILDVLLTCLPDPETSGQALEIASGPGQHVIHFASCYPQITWQPSDIEQEYLQSISAHIKNAGLKNVKPPVFLDITKPLNIENLQPHSCVLIVNINMIHISPWETALGLFKTAGSLLQEHGVLLMYGPYKFDGSLTPESNVRFDANLRARDPRWGVRDLVDVEKLAQENNLVFEKKVAMPANNFCIVFRRTK